MLSNIGDDNAFGQNESQGVILQLTSHRAHPHFICIIRDAKVIAWNFVNFFMKYEVRQAVWPHHFAGASFQKLMLDRELPSIVKRSELIARVSVRINPFAVALLCHVAAKDGKSDLASSCEGCFTHSIHDIVALVLAN
jgi:hypothetical protein